MPQTKSTFIKFRPSRPARNYIQTTKGGTRYVRAIDVLRSVGGRKAIGALLEVTNDSDAPSSQGAANGSAAPTNTSTHSEASASNKDDASKANVESAVMRRASSSSR